MVNKVNFLQPSIRLPPQSEVAAVVNSDYVLDRLQVSGSGRRGFNKLQTLPGGAFETSLGPLRGPMSVQRSARPIRQQGLPDR